MKEKVEADKTEQEMRNLECQIVIQRDQYDLEQEKQKQNQRAKSLIRVTTRNKEVKSIDNICRHTIVFLFHIQLMENKWEYDQWNRAHQWHVERAILADDPVNWSKTMT